MLIDIGKIKTANLIDEREDGMRISRLIGTVVGLAVFLVASLSWSADFNGDGRDDVAVYRPTTGLWAIRGLTRVYFGGVGDTPVPGDYNNDGTDDITIFRRSNGMWASRGLSRVYFGAGGDIPIGGGGAPLTNGQGLYATTIGNSAFATGTCSQAISNEGYYEQAHATGKYARAVGWTTASGDYSTAIGEGAIASGDFSMARGQLSTVGMTIASGKTSTAIGSNAMATGWYSYACGYRIYASGKCSSARGMEGDILWSDAYGDFSTVIGIGVMATAKYATAVGNFVLAQGEYSYARGKGDGTVPGRATRSLGDYATAIGFGIQADGDYSLAVGNTITNPGDFSVAIGSFIELSDSADRAFVFGHGTEEAPIIVEAPDVAVFYGTDVGIGIAKPVRPLHVNDVMRLEPRDFAPADPGEGDIYFNSTDHMLYCYADGDWRPCFSLP